MLLTSSLILLPAKVRDLLCSEKGEAWGEAGVVEVLKIYQNQTIKTKQIPKNKI